MRQKDIGKSPSGLGLQSDSELYGQISDPPYGVRKGAPQNYDRKCPTVIRNWSSGHIEMQDENLLISYIFQLTFIFLVDPCKACAFSNCPTFKRDWKSLVY
jgi:hypothetical protein